MKNFMLLAVAVLVMCLVLGSGVVSAVEQSKASKPNKANSPWANSPCATDVQKFCKDVKPGEGRIIKCLQSHKSELSEACTSMFENYAEPKDKPDKGNKQK